MKNIKLATLFALVAFVCYLASCSDDDVVVDESNTNQQSVTVYDTVRTTIYDTVQVVLPQNDYEGLYVYQLNDFLQSKIDPTLYYNIKILDKNPNFDTIRFSLWDASQIKVNLDLRECEELEEIRDYALYYCQNLIKISIPNSVEHIGKGAFYHCSSLQEINLPESLTSISANMFDSCVCLSNIKIPESVTEIRVRAFAHCRNLREITIPNSVTTIGWGAFENCTSLNYISIPSSVTEICGFAFAYCTDLWYITIPESVTEIGEGAFCNCTRLQDITIPKSVTEIGDYAFSWCTGLNWIRIESSNPPTISQLTFYNYTGKIYVPSSALDTYKAANYWKGLADQIDVW